MTPTTDTVSFEPVERWIRLRLGPTDHNGHLVQASSTERMARYLGVSPRSVERWRRDGLGVWAADNVATRLGHHPTYFWADWCDLPDPRQRKAS